MATLVYFPTPIFWVMLWECRHLLSCYVLALSMMHVYIYLFAPFRCDCYDPCHLRQAMPNFHRKSKVTCRRVFTVEIWHNKSNYFRGRNYASLALGDTDYDNHIGGDEQVYIYIHISCTMQAHRVGK